MNVALHIFALLNLLGMTQLVDHLETDTSPLT